VAVMLGEKKEKPKEEKRHFMSAADAEGEPRYNGKKEKKKEMFARQPTLGKKNGGAVWRSRKGV